MTVTLAEAQNKIVGFKNPFMKGMNTVLAAKEVVSKLPGIGPAPDYLSFEEAKVWDDIAVNMPWLRANHREIFACYCAVVAQFRSGTRTAEIVDKIRHFSNLLGSNPKSDRNIAATMNLNQDDSDPADRFFS